MEFMLHYAWQHRMFPLNKLRTIEGNVIDVISPGTHNTDAGPDFIGAQLKFDGNLWVGNVEIHLYSSDWYRHHHDSNPVYNNVVLHVVAHIDCAVVTSSGRIIPQVQLDIPQVVSENYEELIRSDKHPRCRNLIPTIPRPVITSWLSSLFVERLEERRNQVMERRILLDRNWEYTAFVTIARNFGFGKNGDAFERWAKLIPMSAVSKHRDDLFQIEAIFFGQAGLLDNTECVDTNEYFLSLQHEYRYLSKKFSLQSLDVSIWKFLRLRPQNFPHIRIAQLAMLYYINALNLSGIINASTIDELYDLLQTHVSDFWKTHYSFSSDISHATDKSLSVSSKNLLIINSIVPLLFAYGRYKSDEMLCEKAINLLKQLKPEKNHIITSWNETGIECHSAADSQALIQLTNNYCQTKDCLHCRFGYEYIKLNPGFLYEDTDFNFHN